MGNYDYNPYIYDFYWDYTKEKPIQKETRHDNPDIIDAEFTVREPKLLDNK
jgi:hypothetical protein